MKFRQQSTMPKHVTDKREMYKPTCGKPRHPTMKLPSCIKEAQQFEKKKIIKKK